MANQYRGVSLSFSPEASALGAPQMIENLSQSDVDPSWAAIAGQGWGVVDGAVLLAALSGSYHGDRARFTDVVGFEVAVNGRGIPDLDLEGLGLNAIPILLRRGVAFAWLALSGLRGKIVGQVAGFVTVSPMLFDPDQVTGNVTFCSVGEGRSRYIDIDSFDGIAVRIDVAGVPGPLPGQGFRKDSVG